MFLWKGVWPFLRTQIEANQVILEKRNQEAITFSKETRDAHQQAITAFLAALERRDAEFSKVVAALDSLKEEVRRRRDD
jgi:hypothetical protein